MRAVACFVCGLAFVSVSHGFDEANPSPEGPVANQLLHPRHEHSRQPREGLESLSSVKPTEDNRGSVDEPFSLHMVTRSFVEFVERRARILSGRGLPSGEQPKISALEQNALRQAPAGAASGSDKSFENAPENAKEITAPGFMDFFAQWCLVTGVVAIFGTMCYAGRAHFPVKSGGERPDPDHTFENGHFECFDDHSVCFYSFFCPWLRWAETMSNLGLLFFWLGFILFAATLLVSYFFGIFTAIFLVYWRQQLRERLGFPYGDLNSCGADFCFALFCPCCLIAQEARVVNESAVVGNLVGVLCRDDQGKPYYADSKGGDLRARNPYSTMAQQQAYPPQMLPQQAMPAQMAWTAPAQYTNHPGYGGSSY